MFVYCERNTHACRLPTLLLERRDGDKLLKHSAAVVAIHHALYRQPTSSHLPQSTPVSCSNSTDVMSTAGRRAESEIRCILTALRAKQDVMTPADQQCSRCLPFGLSVRWFSSMQSPHPSPSRHVRPPLKPELPIALATATSDTS